MYFDFSLCLEVIDPIKSAFSQTSESWVFVIYISDVMFVNN